MPKFTEEDLKNLGIDHALLDRLENEDCTEVINKIDFFLAASNVMDELLGRELSLEELFLLTQSQYAKIC